MAKRPMHEAVVQQVAKRGRACGSSFSFSASRNPATGLPMGRTCRECGWMKDVGAASLLETKLWVLTRQRGSTLSASSDRNNHAACCGRCGKGCAARGRHGKKRGAPAAGPASASEETQRFGQRSRLLRAAERAVGRFRVPGFAGNAEICVAQADRTLSRLSRFLSSATQFSSSACSCELRQNRLSA